MKGGGKGARKEPVCLLIARITRPAVTQSCGSERDAKAARAGAATTTRMSAAAGKTHQVLAGQGHSQSGRRGQTLTRAFAAPALRGPPPLTPARDCPPEPMGNRLRAASSDVGPSEPAHQVQCLAEQNSEAMNLSQAPNHPQLKNRPDSIRLHHLTRLLWHPEWLAGLPSFHKISDAPNLTHTLRFHPVTTTTTSPPRHHHQLTNCNPRER